MRRVNIDRLERAIGALHQEGKRWARLRTTGPLIVETRAVGS